jgi:hypothetical protein
MVCIQIHMIFLESESVLPAKQFSQVILIHYNQKCLLRLDPKYFCEDLEPCQTRPEFNWHTLAAPLWKDGFLFNFLYIL